MKFFAIFIILVLISIVFIAIRNSIIKTENAVKRSWADVANYQRQKVKTLEALEPMVKQYSDFEAGTLKEITLLRQNILDLNGAHRDIKKLQQIESQTSSLMKGLHLTVENYPTLKADQIYQKFMAEITDQNANVAAAINIFNRNVEQFNNNIQIFPNSIVNEISLKKPCIEIFKDSVVDKEFEYKPNF